MKSKVRLSTYSVVLTIVIAVVMIASCAAAYPVKSVFYTLLALFLVMVVFAMLYAPLTIKADEDYITVTSLLRRKRIPMFRVESVELFKPTMGAIRLFASGGFMGYWGIFREGDIGLYSAYYGKASDCFLLRLRNGDKYILGCADPVAMTDYIKSNIKSLS